MALIESQDLSKSRKWNPEPNQYTNRCSSLTPTSVSFLQDIGAWPHIDSSRVQPYQEMQVWDGETGSSISFDWESPTSESSPTVATMTENANLVRSLLSRIASLEDGNTSIFSNTTVAGIDNGIDHPEGPDLSAWPVLSLSPKSQSSETEVPKTIAARLLVGADGINSPVRTYADISTDGWDYNRHGVVASLDLSPLEPEGLRAAYQRFLPSLGGPIALLPLPNNHATLVWSTTIENASYLKSLPTSSLTSMINAAFRLSRTDLSYMLTLPASNPTEHEDELSWRLQHTDLPSHLPPTVSSIQPGTVASFPLRHRHASTYISPRVALIGDAAHVIHPLAGQGLNLGIGDVASLSRTIEYAMEHGMDIGDYLSLEPYPYERWGVNAKVGLACDLLHKMYNVPGNGPVAWGRSLGLDIVNRVPLMKSFFMKQAEG